MFAIKVVEMKDQYTNPSSVQIMRASILVGIGLMAAVDEIIFHQVLGWHHFYDRATSTIGLMSDGFLHAAEMIILVAGFFMLLDLRQKQALNLQKFWPGFFLGAGGFQLFDGLVDHKVLRLHQVRYVDNLLPYDIAWNAAALLLLLIGMVLYKRARKAQIKNTL